MTVKELLNCINIKQGDKNKTTVSQKLIISCV